MMDVQSDSEEDPVRETVLNIVRAGNQHPIVTEWQRQFWIVHYANRGRHTMLAFVGGAMHGIRSKALSLFGVDKTLVVSCLFSPKGRLPDLTSFISGRHLAILFEDIRLDQILENRAIFAPPSPPQLPESLCNSGVIEVYGYQTALIASSDYLPFTESDGLSEGEAFWMNLNIRKVTLEKGEIWC